jgi:hypothetical protein
MDPGPSTLASVVMDDPTSPTLASVVKSAALAQWIPLTSDDPQYQLHAKFWGKESEEEREQRRAFSEGESMQVDDRNMENEMGPGCYVLDIGVDTIGCSQQIWIRQDYIRIYEHCERYYLKVANIKSPRPPSVVITGQPGIGKCFL